MPAALAIEAPEGAGEAVLLDWEGDEVAEAEARDGSSSFDVSLPCWETGGPTAVTVTVSAAVASPIGALAFWRKRR